MTKIADAARITRNGRVTTPKALLAVATITCGNEGCCSLVSKSGSFCSMTCYTAATCAPAPVVQVQPVLTPLEEFFYACDRADWYYNFSDDSAMWRRGKEHIESLEAQAKADATLAPVYEAFHAYIASTINGPAVERPTLDQFTKMPKEAPVTDHVAPCKDMLTTCIDLECQVRKGLREHLLMNVTEQDRPQASKVALVRLERLLNDSEHGHQSPEFFLAHAVQAISDWFDADLGQKPVQKALVEQQTLLLDEVHVQAPKAVLTTTTKAVRKPRTATHQPRTTDNKEHPVTVTVTMTKDEMARAINAAAERLVAEREAIIRATPVVAPEDKPVTIVANKGGRVKVERATAATREHKGTVLPAIVFSDTLTIPALEVGEESMDTLVSAKERSPYNKARCRTGSTVLDKDTTTYRVLMAEHLRLTALSAGKTPATTIVAVVNTEDKAARKVQIQALMDTLGVTKAKAKALLDA